MTAPQPAARAAASTQGRRAAAAHFSLGVAFHQRGKLKAADASYRAALASRPDLAEAHNNLGVTLKERGALDEAIASCRRALEIDPDYAQAHNNLGSLLHQVGESEQAIAAFRRALASDPCCLEALCNLAMALRERGELDRAMACSRRALELDPDSAVANSSLASVLYAQGRLEEAVAAYRQVLALDPAAAFARHMVAALDGTTTEAAPREYVSNLFDRYAPHFERHLVDLLGYRTPALMRRMVDRVRRDRCTSEARGFRRALDLGCGTGLVGEVFRDIVNELQGLDLSPRMLDRAKRKGLYDALHLDDVVEFLERCNGDTSRFDLIVAGDVFIYIGKLEPVFAAASRRMSVGGLFAFSVESLAEGDFALRQSGRYAHSEGYIRRLAREHGFAVEGRRGVAIRAENGVGIEGAVFVFARGNEC